MPDRSEGAIIPAANAENTLTARVVIPPAVNPVSVLGTADHILRVIENGFPNVKIVVVGQQISISGPAPDVTVAADLLRELIGIAQDGRPLEADAVAHAVSLLTTPQLASERPREILRAHGRGISPKTPGQKAYVEAMKRSTIVFAVGPAGTGKTYLAMAQAVAELLEGRIKRLVLTRPAVEAGENLGYLPGTLTEKIDPYLRPLYDALRDMLEPDTLPQLMAAGTVEVAPLAYMRGRTLNDSFIILDEGQNTTAGQMKMFLTRLGFNSHIVVTGDVTQVDLPGSNRSGLVVVRDILEDIEGIEFCDLTSADVVRHHLVGRIIDAYARWDERQHAGQEIR